MSSKKRLDLHRKSSFRRSIVNLSKPVRRTKRSRIDALSAQKCSLLFFTSSSFYQKEDFGHLLSKFLIYALKFFQLKLKVFRVNSDLENDMV